MRKLTSEELDYIQNAREKLRKISSEEDDVFTALQSALGTVVNLRTFGWLEDAVCNSHDNDEYYKRCLDNIEYNLHSDSAI
jgi:hypothetical protein